MGYGQMIITKTPFRVSFVGGGSDLPSFYRQHEGCVLSATINKYMYIVLHPTFNK
jgi:D-glycero-alpha-D-manno-heptose-7-phosphate kinase